MIGIFCDRKGNSECGSDSIFHVDGRLGTRGKLFVAMLQRTRFKNNFPHKFESFTHVYFVKRVNDAQTRIHEVPINTAAVPVTIS